MIIPSMAAATAAMAAVLTAGCATQANQAAPPSEPAGGWRAGRGRRRMTTLLPGDRLLPRS